MAQAFLEITGLYKMYNAGTAGEVVALDHVSLSLAKGEFVTVVGSNAAGKSTLFNAIAGSLQPTSGTITLDGVSVTKLPEHKRAKFISRVRQNPDESVITSMTIAENLSLAKLRVAGGGLSAGVKKAWLPEFETLLKPLGLGLEKRLGEPAALLSGGQKQSLALLMATMTEPKLLLLDEHTAALDPRVSEQILRMTNKVVREKGVTTLMITHNIHHALEYGDRLILLERGNIVFEAAGEAKKKLTVMDIVSKLEGKLADFEEELVAS